MKKAFFGSIAAVCVLLLSSVVYGGELNSRNIEPELPTFIDNGSPSDGNIELFSDNYLDYFGKDEDMGIYAPDENGYCKTLITSYDKNNFCTMNIVGNTVYLNYKNTNYNYKSVCPLPSTKSSYSSDKLITLTDGGAKFTLTLDDSCDGAFLNIIARTDSSAVYSLYNLVKLKKNNGEFFFYSDPDVLDTNLAFTYGDYRVKEYYLTQEDSNISYGNAEIKALADELTEGMTTDYEKIKAVHDWVKENIYYSEPALSDSSVRHDKDTEALETRNCVCQGYSELCASLLRSEGVICAVISGASGHPVTSTTYPNHAWNEAYDRENDRWVIFDSTWDTYSTYDGTTFTKGRTTDSYFDISEKLMATTHRDNKHTCEAALYTYWGDMNADWTLDNTDAAIALNYIITGDTSKIKTYRWSSSYKVLKTKELPDVNGDGKTDFNDCTAIIRHVVHKERFDE